MNKFIYIIFISFYANIVLCQVSIGNSSLPNPNVILDLTNSTNRALLLPSKTSILPTGPQGMMIFDSDDDMIFYSKDGSNLNAISPWNYNPYSSTNVTYNLGGKVGIGNSNPSVKLTISGGSVAKLSVGSSGYMSIGSNSSNHLLFDSLGFMAKNQPSTNADMVTLELQKQGSGSININGNLLQNGKDYIPPGTIMMWKGSVDGDHPSVNGVQNTNWYICNGNNFTPNLRDRFIVGVGSDYANAVGARGGSNTNHHTHNVDFPNYIFDPSKHTHASKSNLTNVTVSTEYVGCEKAGIAYQDHAHTSTPVYHVHHINLPDISTDTVSYENRPPYYSLYFMIKR